MIINGTTHEQYMEELDVYEKKEIRNKMNRKTIPDLEDMMRTLIDFNISEHNYKELETIFFEKYNSFDPDTGGFTDLTNKKIYIRKNLPINMKSDIVLHEFMHLLAYEHLPPNYYANEPFIEKACEAYKDLYPCVNEVINDFMEWI